jgi:RNA polymerase subunit RPABC4/transcription elongation factor Spt4
VVINLFCPHTVKPHGESSVVNFFPLSFNQRRNALKRPGSTSYNVIIMPFCPECGKQVSPTAKFCRNCGASQLEESPNIPATVQPPGPPSVPEGTRATSAEKTGELQPQAPSAVPTVSSPPSPVTEVPPLPNIPSPSAQTPPPSGTRLCRSCGYVINPGDKFCGKCLAKVEDIPVNVPAPDQAPVSPGSPHG